MFKEGDLTPEFTIKTDTNDFKLNLKNKKLTVVFFFPRANTSGCTKEAVEFSSLIEKFNNLNTRVIGVSKDTVEQLKKFRTKHNLKCELGSDYDGKICEMFSVWIEKSMYGKKYMGTERTTILISEKGRILKIWRKVRVPGHVEEVLSFVENN